MTGLITIYHDETHKTTTRGFITMNLGKHARAGAKDSGSNRAELSRATLDDVGSNGESERWA
ncbi:hypothetical protein Mapa_009553 [Marchantia paleacea]|nr:hypothetical protein Mapa_009553 [Marchantia paleacea]